MYYKNIFNKELMKQRKVEESEMRNWLKTLRNNKKFSQADVAKEVKISPQFYSFIENGDRNPSAQVAKRIADVLGFSNEWYKLLEKEKEEAVTIADQLPEKIEPVVNMEQEGLF